MHKVNANSRQEYIAAAKKSGQDLQDLDALIRECAPVLKPWFYNVGPDEPGMTFKMLGYGTFSYKPKKNSNDAIDWPVIGVAIQKNYVSIYFSVTKASQPIINFYKADLQCTRSGNNNFSFTAFGQLNKDALRKLLVETAAIFVADPSNPVCFKESQTARLFA
ncbi:MAG TPA: hypothetical protein VLG11_03075 [Candidatus Saccharimonadales bacterium]|nr:hypothetical protein [Candidatus Saccharimonadales bacterium]